MALALSVGYLLMATRLSPQPGSTWRDVARMGRAPTATIATTMVMVMIAAMVMLVEYLGYLGSLA